MRHLPSLVLAKQAYGSTRSHDANDRVAIDIEPPADHVLVGPLHLLAQAGLQIHLEEAAAIEAIQHHEDVLRIFGQETHDRAEIERAFERGIVVVGEQRRQLAAVAIDGEEPIAKHVELGRHRGQHEAFVRSDGDAEQQTLVCFPVHRAHVQEQLFASLLRLRVRDYLLLVGLQIHDHEDVVGRAAHHDGQVSTRGRDGRVHDVGLGIQVVE